MLRIMRRGSRWIMWIVIIGVGAVFVLYLGIGGGFGGPTMRPQTVVRVADRQYDARDVFRVRAAQEENLRRLHGDAFDAEAAGDFLNEQAARTLLNQALLAMEAERLGLHVSDEERRQYFRRLLGAGPDERIDEGVITQVIEQQYGTLKRFETALHDELLAAKARRLIDQSVAVSETEAREALRYGQEQVSLALVELDTTRPPQGEEPSEAAVQRILDEEPGRVTEAYEARRDEFDRPEEVRARHILFRLAEGDEAGPEAEAEVMERVEAARARLAEGADFADLALELSEDPGSKDQAGDLGFFPRGRMVPAFDEVAFALEPGVVSEPVRSPYGFHLIRVEEKRPASTVSFEEARQEIARDLAREDLASEAARGRAEALSAAIREGRSLVDAAREAGVDIRRPDPLRRRPDGYVPGLGPAPGVMTAAFALDADAPSDPTIHEAGDKLVLIQLLEREEPSAEELEAGLEERRDQLLAMRRQATLTAWIQDLQSELEASGQLALDLEPLR